MRVLPDPACNADIKISSESSPNVLFSPFNFWTRLIPSMIHDEGLGMTSENDMLFSSCRAKVALLVFLRAPSQFPSDQGSGPSG